MGSIELNGKRFDAITGAFLGEGNSTVSIRSSNARHRGRFADIAPSSTAEHHKKIDVQIVPTLSQPEAATDTIAHQPKPKTPNAKRAARHLAPHRPQKPHTLMRHVVHKPKANMKPAIKTQGPTEIMAAPLGHIVPKQSVTKISPNRLERAHQVSKSSRVKHFDAAAIKHVPANRNKSIMSIPAPTETPAQVITPKVTPPSSDIFEAAMARATSHQQTPPKKARRWFGHSARINIIAAVAVFLVIGGFITLINLDNIGVHVASIRAGFHAQIPGYKPSGYVLEGPIQSSTGRVSLNFRSGDSSFRLTQEDSDWDSRTLLENEVTLGGHTYQAIQSKGRTIFVYGDNQAAWVDSGVRYILTGNADLSTDEIVSLATSM